jgi:hypothetical protein
MVNSGDFDTLTNHAKEIMKIAKEWY